jgi:hypothetical protein
VLLHSKDYGKLPYFFFKKKEVNVMTKSNLYNSSYVADKMLDPCNAGLAANAFIVVAIRVVAFENNC